jgi:hypothetical protein
MRTLILASAIILLASCAAGKTPDDLKTELAASDATFHYTTELGEGCGDQGRLGMIAVSDNQSQDARLARRAGCVTVVVGSDFTEVGRYYTGRNNDLNNDTVVRVRITEDRTVSFSESDGEMSVHNTSVFSK